MKKKISANVITYWLEGCVSQTHQMGNNGNTIYNFGCFFSNERSNQTPQEELRSFKFVNVMYY